MTQDLFLSGEERLYAWMKERQVIKSHELLKWGIENYVNDPHRLARRLSVKGKIRRMNLERAKMLTLKEQVWEVCDALPSELPAMRK